MSASPHISYPELHEMSEVTRQTTAAKDERSRKTRLQPAPPFSFIGVDVFGPWVVVTRTTRGAHAKAVLFTCFVIRDIHIEVIEEMSTVSSTRVVASWRSGANFVCSARTKEQTLSAQYPR